mmetsp:Transcript_20938/g.34578  ORF Transcript_20938/g.34578 Transcript_20938/m.34578 type:complete len:100 (+) Transcript_20938:47-346(+)
MSNYVASRPRVPQLAATFAKKRLLSTVSSIPSAVFPTSKSPCQSPLPFLAASGAKQKGENYCTQNYTYRLRPQQAVPPDMKRDAQANAWQAHRFMAQKK